LKSQIFLLFVLGLFGCTNQTSQDLNASSFVDIHGFFEAEVERLSATKVSVFKRTRMDTVSSSDSVATPLWSKELYAFLDVDIKPSVWKTDFQKMPVSHDEPNETADVYLSTNPNQHVNAFKIKLDESGNIERFSAEIIERGKISTSVTALSYTKNVGYSLSIDRETKLMGNESYQIVGQFYTNN
jgi:hypothetical protein